MCEHIVQVHHANPEGRCTEIEETRACLPKGARVPHGTPRFDGRQLSHARSKRADQRAAFLVTEYRRLPKCGNRVRRVGVIGGEPPNRLLQHDRLLGGAIAILNRVAVVHGLTRRDEELDDRLNSVIRGLMRRHNCDGRR